MAEHIIAVFGTETDASSAVRSLKIAGIPPGAIRQYSGNHTNRSGVITEAHAQEPESGGFWAWLFGDEPVSETTRSAYASDMDMYDRRIRAGNCIVSVMVDESMIHEAIDVLNRYSPIDIDEHTDEHGYADHPAGSYGASTETLPATAEVNPAGIGEREPGKPLRAAVGASGIGERNLEERAAGYVAAGAAPTGAPVSALEQTTPGLAGTPTGYATTGPASEITPPTSLPAGLPGRETGMPSTGTREEVIPLAEEQLQVGKRTIEGGTTRIRRYVVEKPIEQDVTLRNERVTVEKRRPLGAGEAPGAGAFEERTVEVRETQEEPVVNKAANVVEEVVIGRESTERTETVRDTVRKEEVEITGNGRRDGGSTI